MFVNIYIPKLPCSSILRQCFQRNSWRLCTFENSDSLTEIVQVVFLADDAVAVVADHVGGGLGVQSPEIDTLVAIFHADHGILARLGLQTLLVVVVEETVETGTIDKHVLAVDKTKSPSLGASVRSGCGIGTV